MTGTTIRLPDGEEVDIQTDDPKVAVRAAQAHWEALETRRRDPQRSALQTAGDFLGDTVDNLTPNWGDEIAATPAALKALVSGEDVGAAFKGAQDEFRENQASYDKNHPVLAWGSTLAGVGAGLALPAGNLARGASMASRMAHGAAVGAAYGGVAGAGQGEGLEQRTGNATKGAGYGSVAGAGMAPLSLAATLAGRWAKMRLPGFDSATRTLANIPRAVLGRPRVHRGQRAVEQADRMMGREMRSGNIQEGFGRPGAPATPEAIVAEQERRQALGVPAIPGDVTEPMRNLTSWASRGMGPGQSMVKSALDGRKATEAGRIRDHITAEMGPAVDPVRQVAEYGERARREAAPMYAEAYAQPIVLTPEMRGIAGTPAFQDAVPNAIRNIRNAQRDPEAMGFVMRPDGTLDPESYQFLSTEAFDQVIRAMRDSGRAAADVNPLTGQVINNTNSVHINARAGDLQNELADQNGAYRDVTRMYANEMGMRDAFQRGQDVKNLTGAEIGEQARQTPQANARAAWSIGARTALADSASEYGAKYPTGDTAAHVRKQLGDDFKQEAIGELTGNPAAVQGLQDRLEAETQGNILWKEVNGNSKTAPRQQLDADLDDAAGGAALSSLTPRGMLTSVINHISRAASTQFRNDVKARIAQVATEANPATVRDLMAAIADRAERDQDFATALHRAGVIGAKAYGMNIVGNEAASPLNNDDVDQYEDLVVDVTGGS